MRPSALADGLLPRADIDVFGSAAKLQQPPIENDPKRQAPRQV
jgi:hypothetical protein